MRIANLLLGLGAQISLTGCKKEPTHKDPQPDSYGGVGPGIAAHQGTGADCIDLDQDGYCETDDCDDTNTVVYPGAIDISDHYDNDCDGETDEDKDVRVSGFGGRFYDELPYSPPPPPPRCVDLDLDGICSTEDCDDRNYRAPREEACGARVPEVDPLEEREACDSDLGAPGHLIEWSCNDGESRLCGTCDYGSQVCVGGVWGACDWQPPAEGLEACDCHQLNERFLDSGILFILDTSGSMEHSYRHGGGQKYAAAVAGIHAILNAYGDRVDFGILAFPTNWECEVGDDQTPIPQVPIGGGAAAIEVILGEYQPGGGTPLGESIRLGKLSLEDYRNNHPNHTIGAIILSDGEETCGGDPVSQLNDLLGAGFRAYLLDSSGGDLDDVAAALNNPQRIHDVQNAAELAGALDLILEEVSVSVSFTEEACNGADDDCDGVTDEGFLNIRYEGPLGTMGRGVCKPEVWDCVDGALRVVHAGAVPGEEICDGQDNDCDGEPDECFQLEEACKWFGHPDEQRANPCYYRARNVCTPDGNSVGCYIPVPTEEVCNGIDDDCNSIVDDLAQGECPAP